MAAPQGSVRGSSPSVSLDQLGRPQANALASALAAGNHVKIQAPTVRTFGKHIILTINPPSGCITTADHLTSVRCTCFSRPKRLSGRPSAPLWRSHPARRWPPQECQQPGGCFGHSSGNSRAANGQPSTKCCSTTTSVPTASPTASQQCAHHQRQPGRCRRVDTLLPGIFRLLKTLSSASLGCHNQRATNSPFHALLFLLFTSCQFILKFCYVRSYFVHETHTERK